jgi:hypothetical protein
MLKNDNALLFANLILKILSATKGYIEKEVLTKLYTMSLKTIGCC